MTSENAEKTLNDMRSNPKNPLWAAYWNKDPENPKKDKIHPDHDKVVARAKALSQLAYKDRPMRGAR
jgi:hypothetical protein